MGDVPQVNGWMSVEFVDSVQVFPTYEHGHTLGLDCCCGPRVEREDPEDGERYRVPMVVHRDQLDREGPSDPENHDVSR